MKSCEEARERLSDLLFGEMDGREELALNRHLGECPACREEEARLLRLREDLEREPAVAEPELRERIRAVLPVRRRSRRPGLLRRPVPFYAAAAACLLAIAFALWLPVPSRNGGDPGTVRVLLEPSRAGFFVAGSYETAVRLEEEDRSEQNPLPGDSGPAADSL